MAEKKNSAKVVEKARQKSEEKSDEEAADQFAEKVTRAVSPLDGKKFSASGVAPVQGEPVRGVTFRNNQKVRAHIHGRGIDPGQEVTLGYQDARAFMSSPTGRNCIACNLIVKVS